ncbi:MAG: adenine phosphoribosyltransferase [Actinomycetota bacterium]
MDDLRALIRDVPDFPEPGVVFKDITPLLGDWAALAGTVRRLAQGEEGRGITKVVGIESRGFILGPPVAVALGVGFVPVRKFGKLPWTTVSRTYELEYGSDTLEMHADALGPADRVVVVDDVLATGGTAAATIELVRHTGAAVAGLAVLIELGFLGGRSRIDVPVRPLITYE